MLNGTAAKSREEGKLPVTTWQSTTTISEKETPKKTPVDFSPTPIGETTAVAKEEPAPTSGPGLALIQLDEATKRLEELEKLIAETFSADAKVSPVHTHEYCGVRTWKDNTCPICRAKNAIFVDQRHEKQHQESILDKEQLNQSLLADRTHLQTEREWEESKRKAAVATALFNQSLCKNAPSRSQLEVLPVGDVFEHRKVIHHDPKLPYLVAENVREQIRINKEKREKEKADHELEERLIAERLRKEYTQILSH
jgi:hypothetical protein